MISKRLQKLMNEKQWSQSRLASEIFTHPGTVNRWLRAKMSPSQKTLAHISKVTGCRLDWLLTGEGEMFSRDGVESASLYPAENWEEHDEDEEGEMDEWLEGKEREKEIAKLLARASTVLNFQFKHHTRCYSDSLAATINALYRAVRLEEKFIPKKGLMALLERADKERVENK